MNIIIVMISIILNLITLLILGIFAFFVYISYRQRDDLTVRPIDIMRDIVGGQSTHTRLHKVVPFKRLMYGPMGEFGNYDTGVDLSRLEGNFYEYPEGEQPWENEEDANFGSYSGVTVDEIKSRNLSTATDTIVKNKLN